MMTWDRKFGLAHSNDMMGSTAVAETPPLQHVHPFFMVSQQHSGVLCYSARPL